MNKKIVVLAITSLIMMQACNKDKNENTSQDFESLKTSVIKDFTNNIALKNYSDLNVASQQLNTSIWAFNSSATDANLIQAQNDWKAMRAIWEQAEGFLFGPVEDNDYDPQTDTWPTDYNQMDSLLASSNPLGTADLVNLSYTLRGYHPIEYILFGANGSRAASTISARQKTYLLSLSEELKNTCQALYASWSAAPTQYAEAVLQAGSTSTIFKTKQELYVALVDGMAGICEEVGTGKMEEPYVSMDSSIVESPYAGTSMIDFRNNVVGIQNVYLGRYGATQGLGIKDLVAAKNKSLDNKIQNEIAQAIAAMDNVTVPFEMAIFTQRVQTQNAMDQLATLQATLENELKPFVLQYITD